MNIEEAREYCLQLKGVTEGFPFGETVLVFKVMGKMFALLALDREEKTMNLKCDPEKAIELREEYQGQIIPGYHMSKTHWNTIYIESGLSDPFIKELILHSYDLVVSSLTKKLQAELKANY